MTAAKPVAYSYERVSTGQQVSGRGLGRQADMAAAWCKQHGYRLDAKLDLSDAGRSAFKGDHISKGALGEFLRLAEAGELGASPVLLIEAVDRLSRQEPMQALQRVVFTLVEAGVRIVDLEDGRTYDRESLAGDALIMLVLRCKAAHEYSSRLSRRIRDSWADTKQALRDGTAPGRGPNGGKHPYWLTLNTTTKQWELNQHADDVRLIFDELLCRGLTLVAQSLNAKGSLSPGGKKWAHYSVRKVATDPAAYGALRLGIYDQDQARAARHRWLKAKAEAEAKGIRFRAPEPVIPPVELVPDHYPAVVSREVFDRVTAALNRRGQDKRAGGNRRSSSTAVHTFLQAGVAECQHGGTMGAHLSRKPGRDDIYYLRCRARLGGKGCRCNGKGWRLESIQAHVVTRLSGHLLGQAVLPGNDHSAELKALNSRLRAATEQLAAATAQTTKASASLEQAVDAGAQLDLLENLSHLLETRRAVQRSAEAQVDQLKTDIAHLTARTNPAAELNSDPVRDLLQALANGTDTQAERERLHRVLVRAGLQVVLDDSSRECLQVGMRFGDDAQLAWQPFNPQARGAAARLGATQPAVVIDRGDEVIVSQGPIPPELQGQIDNAGAVIAPGKPAPCA